MQTIETTAGEATLELQRRGLKSADHVTIIVDSPGELFSAARNASRAKVMAAGLSDDTIDDLIRQAREEIAAESQ